MQTGLIEIGICSDVGGTALSGVRGVEQLRSEDDPDRFAEICAGFLGHLRTLMEEHDPAARIQFTEIVPPEEHAELFGQASLDHDMPVK